MTRAAEASTEVRLEWLVMPSSYCHSRTVAGESQVVVGA